MTMFFVMAMFFVAIVCRIRSNCGSCKWSDRNGISEGKHGCFLMKEESVRYLQVVYYSLMLYIQFMFVPLRENEKKAKNEESNVCFGDDRRIFQFRHFEQR